MSEAIQNRTYQDEAVSVSIRALKEEDRAQLHMCCASGKTYVQAKTLRAHLLQNNEARPVYTVFVPNLGLVRQSEINFRKILGDNIEYLGIGTNKERKKDEPSDITGRMTMTTDADQISTAVEARIKPLVIFSTYQSSPVLSEALIGDDGEVTPVSLSFMDEAHRTAGIKENDSPFAYPLFDHNIDIRKRLFYTATPNTVEFNEENQERIVSMNNPELYGQKVFDYPYSRALKDGVVSPFRIHAPVVTKAEIQAYRELKSLGDEDDPSIISELALRKVMKLTGHDKVLTFHSTVAKSKAFASRLDDTFGKQGFHIAQIDGDSSADERQAAFEKILEGPTIIPSVRAIGEGSDAPGIQSVLFAEPRKSVTEVIQNIGRLQRKDPNDPDKVGSIVCPILIDEASKDSPEEQILNSDFATIFRVAEGLRASNDVASLTIKNASREFGRTGDLPKGRKFGIELIGGTVLSEQKINDLEEALQVMTFESMADTFEVNSGKMDRFIQESGRFPHEKDKNVLFNWLASSRQRMFNGQLSEDQNDVIERFDRIEAGMLKESRRTEEFDRQVAQINFLDLFYDDVDNIPESAAAGLPEWLDRTRTEHLDDHLSINEISKLEDSSIWSWHAPDEDMHNVYRHRDRFFERNGHEPSLNGDNAEMKIAQAILAEQERQLSGAGIDDARIRDMEKMSDLEADRRALLKSADKVLPWQSDGATEETLLNTLNEFYARHSRPPELQGRSVDPQEAALAQELDKVEQAYINTFVQPIAISDNRARIDNSFEVLTPSQKRISESRAFLADKIDDENQSNTILSGRFRPSKTKSGWIFEPTPSKDADGKVDLFKTGHRVAPMPIKMHLTESQSMRIRALGPKHRTKISIKRAGKVRDPFDDGALKKMISVGVQRDESNYFNWVVARYNDRTVSGKPSYTNANIQAGKVKPGELVTVLGKTAKRRLCTVSKFNDEIKNLRSWSFNGKHNQHQIKTLGKLPGFTWYEHGDGAENLQKTIKMISKRFDNDTLGNASLRKGNTGLANTLREVDNSMRLYAKRGKRNPIFTRIDEIKPNTSRSIMVAAKVHQDYERQQREYAAKRLALKEARSAKHTRSGIGHDT